MGNHLQTASRHRDERGASSVEYALLLTLIALTIILAATAFGVAVGDMFDL